MVERRVKPLKNTEGITSTSMSKGRSSRVKFRNGFGPESVSGGTV